MNFTPDIVTKILEPYCRCVSRHQCDQISRYIDLLTRWNRRVSLTAVDKPEEILRFHFGESIFALQYCDFSAGRLADVGSGAGFPGLALKILRPELKVVLIEPNLRKSAFLAEVVRSLELDSVEVISKPFAESAIPANSLQFVTSRALSQSSAFLSWSMSALQAGGRLVLWASSDAAPQISEDACFVWSAPVIIPGTKRRALLIGRRLPG